MPCAAWPIRTSHMRHRVAPHASLGAHLALVPWAHWRSEWNIRAPRAATRFEQLSRVMNWRLADQQPAQPSSSGRIDLPSIMKRSRAAAAELEGLLAFETRLRSPTL